jgi:hypothetical protein
MLPSAGVGAWGEWWDPASKRPYWFNSATGASTYEMPAAEEWRWIAEWEHNLHNLDSSPLTCGEFATDDRSKLAGSPTAQRQLVNLRTPAPLSPAEPSLTLGQHQRLHDRVQQQRVQQELLRLKKQHGVRELAAAAIKLRKDPASFSVPHAIPTSPISSSSISTTATTGSKADAAAALISTVPLPWPSPPAAPQGVTSAAAGVGWVSASR